MSDDSIISDTGDINEGEGAKIVQSSIMTQSIMKSESFISSHAFQAKPEEKKKDANSFEIQKVVQEKPSVQRPNPPPSNPKNSNEKRIKKPASLQTSTPKFQKNSNKSISNSFSTPKIKFIPVLNKDTANPNTFDLSYLLHPEVQKIAKSGHRLTQSNTVSATGSFVNTKVEAQQKEKSSRSLYNSVSSKSFLQDFSKPAGKKLSIDVDERFYKKAKKTEEKVKTLKDIKDMEEINNCTFHPKIKTKRKTKTCDEYFDYMKNFVEKKDKKVIKLREDHKKAEESIDFTHQPKICEKSIQIMAQKSEIENNTFDRLHKTFKFKNNSCENTHDVNVADSRIEETVRPKIFKKQNIQRSEPVDKLLYKDAIRRQKRKNSMPEKKSQKLITISSERVLIEKLKRDFQECFSQVDVDNSDHLNYTKTIEVLKLMNLVQETSKKDEERLLILEAWKQISNESNSYVEKSSLLTFVLSVMGFHEVWMSDQDYTTFSVSPKSGKKLHSKFHLFYANRTTSQHKFSSTRSIKDLTEVSSNQNSSSFGKVPLTCRSSMRFEGKIEDHLIAEKERVKKKIEDLRIQITEEEMEHCSFHPLIEQMPEESKIQRVDKEDLSTQYFKQLNNSEAQYKHRGLFLHDLSKVFQDKKQEIASSHREKELMKELEVCTFTPHIEKKMFSDDLEGFDKKPQKKKKILCLFKRPAIEKGRKSLEFYEHSQSKSTETKEKHEKTIEEPKTKENSENFFNLIKCMKGIATISVNTGKGKEIIEFNFKEEDPACVVIDFSSQFGLNKDQEYKLVKELTLIKYKNL
jgi:hypothetical protein